jgi:hypothetical protein
MCECGHELDTYDTHLACYPFKGQQIITHDTIKNVIYVFIQDNKHIVWIEWWYALMLGTSL